MDLGNRLRRRFDNLNERREEARRQAERNTLLDRDENRFAVIRRDPPRALRHLVEASLPFLLDFAAWSYAMGLTNPPMINEENVQPPAGYTNIDHYMSYRSIGTDMVVTAYNLMSLFVIPRRIQERFDALQQGSEIEWTVDNLIQTYRQWAERNRIRPAPVEDLPVEGAELEELRELDMLPIPSPTDLLSGAAKPYFVSATEESLPAPPSVVRDEPPTSVGRYASQPRAEAMPENVEEM